jgi:hypothetical protein
MAVAGGVVQLLSVPQPWAWAIARGRKPVENREWAPTYRGDLAIYAPVRVDLRASENPLISFAGWDPGDPAAAMGGIVAVVTLAGVCSAAMAGEGCDCGEWAQPNAYHWRLTDPQPLVRPVASIGRSGRIADGIPARAISHPDLGGEDYPSGQGRLWEAGPTVVAEVTAAVTGP